MLELAVVTWIFDWSRADESEMSECTQTPLKRKMQSVNERLKEGERAIVHLPK